MNNKQLKELQERYAKLPGKLIHRRVRENIPSDTKPEEYGMKLQDIPREYLEWIILNVENRPGCIEMIQKFMGVPPSPLPPISAAKGTLSRRPHTICRIGVQICVARPGSRGARWGEGTLLSWFSTLPFPDRQSLSDIEGVRH
jgi:hypothetical protein